MSIDIIKAEQQLTGFSHAYQGYDIISLVEAMGLREEEWEELREDAPWLPDELRIQIDDYFKKG